MPTKSELRSLKVSTLETPQAMAPSRLRWVVRVAGILLLCAAIVGVPVVRTPILQAAGSALVVEEAIVGPADIIVVAVGADGAGVLEAADLVRRGIATRVGVFPDPPDEVDREFMRRGIPYEDRAARSIRQLKALGVATVEQAPNTAAGTRDESDILPAWCDQRQFRSVIVVTTSDHSRRLRRVLVRAMQGRDTKLTIRSSRYSQFDPDRWWQTRTGIRTGVVELEKLVLDVVRHPLS